MGTSTISMAIFNSKLLVYQRVNDLGSMFHLFPRISVPEDQTKII